MSGGGLLLLGLVAVGAAVVASLFALGILGGPRKAILARLEVVAPRADPTPDAGVVRSADEGSTLVRVLTSGTSLAKIKRNVLLAGRPAGWTVPRVLAMKLIFSLVGVFLLLIMLSSGSSAMAWLLGATAIFVGYVSPGVLIQKRAEARQKLIQQQLPDVLDQVTISLEAGLGFEAAFAHIGERRSGPLAEEIVRTVQDMRLGMSRRDAYQSMADRTDVDDMRRFVKSIIQAEQYGVSIATVVKTQAVEMRFRRRKRAEAAAMKVPVKITFPLLVCILPVLFIVILTPAVVSMSKSL
ncbi:type II secretion system F family protein [Aeromicrobium sp.]|uniref:type II secretion system F family protein n=1 Tax=Aeromicrobium sp. TaxID=1871063 RepID=UPI0019A65E3C|nr:type II secretion system F family protein [Aeromicrobium sp.]MBC7632452.1 type II secretion system F family protein [Aeromicrobium sp.]